MGAFDDLIPAQPVAAVGAFDDLIPKQATAPTASVDQSPFADLVPQSSSPSSLGKPLSDADLASLSQPVTAELTGPQDVSGFVKQASPSALQPSVVSAESAEQVNPAESLFKIPSFSPGESGKIARATDITGLYNLLPKEYSDRLAGILQNASADTANFFTSPAGAAVVGGGMIPGVGKAISATFLAQALKNTPDTVMKYLDAKTPQEKDDSIKEMIEQGAIIAGTAAHTGLRPSKLTGGGERPAGLSQTEADRAAVQNQLRSLTPPQTPLTKEAQPILPDVADSLVLAREKLTDGFNSLPVETQRARQASIDDIDNQLLQVSRDDVQAAEARVAARGQSPPSEVAGEPPVAPGGPSGNLGTSSLFRQAKSEAGIPEEAPPESTPEPPAEATAIDPDMAKAAQDTAERIADQVTQGQSSAVRDAARDAAMDNAMSSMKAGKSPSAAFMRASAKEAAGKASATQGVSLDAENEQGTTAGEQQASGENTPVQDAAKADTVQAVQDTVSQLPENLRKTAQAFLENPDKSLRELADDLGVSHQTVANHLKAMQEHFQALKDEGMSLGPGAASAVEKINETLNPTGLKRVTVDTERLARGAEPIPSEARQNEDAVVRAAEDQAHTDPTAAPALVSRIVDQGDRAISEKDAASLLVERQRIMNERAQWEDRLGRGEDVDEAKTQLTNLEGQLNRLDRAQRAAGTTWGRLGHMYQRMIKDDFTLESMERKLRAAKEGPLTEEERGKLKEQADKISELQKQVDDKQAGVINAAQDAEAHRMVEATINELGKNYLKSPNYSPKVFEIARRVVDKWKADAQQARADLSKALGVQLAGIPNPAIVLHVARILRAEIGEFGLNKTEAFAKVVSEFGEKVKPHLEKAWSQAQKLIGDENTDSGVKAALKEGITKAGEKTEAQAKAAAKADAVAGEPLSHKTAYEMVRALIQSGVHGTDALMKAAHKGLKEAYPDLTERDVRRAFSEYGKVKFPSKEATSVELAETRRITQLQESIDRLNEGKDALHTGLQREKATQQVREKQKELNELLKKREGPPSPEKLASRDEAKQTALKNQIADIDKELRTGEKPVKGQPAPDNVKTEQLKAERDAMKSKLQEIEDAKNPPKTEAEKFNDRKLKYAEKRTAELQEKIKAGDFTRPAKAVPPALTNETFEAQAKLARAQNEFNRGVEKQRLANRTPSQKFWDHFVGIERAMKLSSDVVLGKLSVAAALREGVLTPVEEGVGGALSKALPGLAERSPREGGLNLKAEMKAKAAAFTSGMKDAYDNLRMRQSSLDELYGKEKNVSPSWYDYFGFLHGALKAPVKRAEFARSLEKRMEFARKNGEDINDIQVMGRLSQEAYLDANRSIFMQDNVVSDTIKNALNMAEKSKKAPNLGPALARIGRFLLPIVKVPTNIVGEVATGVHGVATGGLRTAKAYYGGIQTLPPEQADSIMRQLKKGLVGNALLLTGYYGYKAIGGFYQPKDQRAESDVQPDHYRVGKVNLPGFVGHSTAAMLLNIGATLHREELKKGLPSAVSGTGGGVVKQLPFVPAVTNAVEALQSDEGMKKYLQNLLISSTVPAGVAHAAKVADTPGTFPSNAFTPANKRSPSTFSEGFKAVIPGLRPQVPSDRQSSRPVGSRRR